MLGALVDAALGELVKELIDAALGALVGEQVDDALGALVDAALGELVQELIDAALGVFGSQMRNSTTLTLCLISAAMFCPATLLTAIMCCPGLTCCEGFSEFHLLTGLPKVGGKLMTSSLRGSVFGTGTRPTPIFSSW